MSPKTHRAKLAELMTELFRSGLFVQFSCSPTAAIKGQKIEVRAVFYTPRDLGTKLKPVVRCEEILDFPLKLEEQPSSSRTKRQFCGKFNIPQTGVSDGTLSLFLQGEPSGSVVAKSEVHVFTDSELDSFKTELGFR